MSKQALFPRNIAKILLLVSLLFGLHLTSLYSFLLFHTIVELFSIVIAGTIFFLAWNFRRFYQNSFLPFIGTAYLFCGVIDLVHTLAYKGMGIFSGYDANLPTQLWIAARFLQSAALLAAPLLLRRKVRMEWLVAGFGLAATLLLLSIFTWGIFPTSYIEGVGLTPFKIASEYTIDLILAAAIVVLWRSRRGLDRKVLQWMTLSIGFTMASELAFTFYIDVYGFSNLVGHFGKILASLLVYKAVIETEAGAIYADMTRLRETEQALRQSELRAQKSLAELHGIYANTPVGLCSFDMELRIQAINDMLATITGRPAEAHIGKTLHEVLPADIARRAEGWLRDVLETGRPVLNQEVSGMLDHGARQLRHWLVSCHPVFGEDGIVRGASCVVQDMTEKRRAEVDLAQAHRALQETAERLKHSNQELEQFAFVASHDLQEPLRKITMFGSRLQRQIQNLTEDGLPEESAEAVIDSVRRMQNAAGRMQAMIDGLLALSRVNTRAANFEPASLNALVGEVVGDLEARIQATGGQVVVGELYSAEVDALQIRQLFQNLIGNALKFHKPGVPPFVEVNGAIVLTPGPEAAPGGSVTICVTDNGIGFDEQFAEQLFQPFQRLHGRNDYEGTGLGLSICQKIVERHHGKIEARSQAGEGATFFVTLPCKQPG